MNRTTLNINHPDKVRAEAFLNSLNEELEVVSFDWKSLKQSTRIVDAAKLSNNDKTLTITIIFTESYGDADHIINANFIKGSVRWGNNGSLMYLVESSDSDKVNSILSIFAGEE
ncbi:hypothetical protein MYP_3208 [Sporocytophaga myxococcoides]|uniref:Uncharacterized protein n=1 Tax=Sporocytophaga myxococcoides TaxID=153721 RepID=A0A098LHQ6_9BACT|nr:hypothetical protein [Sporocytophaga myxococcoides]GAL85979.1 hypothetical protein MYP_3208 [Sporocytophaga myxococcoides]